MFSNQKIAVVAAASLFLLGSLAAQAETSCKGSEKKVCQSDLSCRWVNGYKRSDGIEVKGHCRSLPAKKTTAKESKSSKS